MIRLLFILVVFSVNLSLAQSLYPEIQTGHMDQITSMQFTDDDKRLLTGSMDEMLVQWSINTQVHDAKVLNLLKGVSCFKFNEEAKLLAVATYNKQVVIYDFKDSTVFGPKWTYDFTHHVKFIDVNNAGSHIAASSGYNICVMDTAGEMSTVFGGDDIMGLRFLSDNKTLVFGNYDGDIFKYNTQLPSSVGMNKLFNVGNIISEIALDDSERYLAYGTSGGPKLGGEIGVFDLKKNKLVSKQKNFIVYLGAQFGSIHFIDKKSLIYVNKDGGINRWNFKRDRDVNIVSKAVNLSIDVSNNKEWLAYAIDADCYVTKLGSTSQPLKFTGYAENPIRFVGLHGHTMMVEYPSGIKKWDLKELRTEMVLEKFYDGDWSYTAFSHDLELKANNDFIRNVKTGEFVEYYMGTSANSRFGGFSGDKRFYSFLDQSGQLTICCLDTAKLPFWTEKHLRHWNYNKQYALINIDDLIINPYKNEMVLLTKGFDYINLETGEYKQMTNKVRGDNPSLPALFDPVQNKLLVATSRTVYDSIAYEGREGYASEWTSLKRSMGGSSGDRYLNKKSGTISIYNLDDMTAPYYLVKDSYIDKMAEVTAMTYDPNYNIIYVAYGDGTVKLLKTTDSGYYSYNWTRFTSAVHDMVVSDDGLQLYIINKYGAVGVVDVLTLDYLVSLVATSDNEFIAIDQKGFYKRSKNAQNAVAFVQGEYILKLNQVDDRLNKPHVIYKDMDLLEFDRLKLIQKLAGGEDVEEVKQIVGPELKILKSEKLDITTSKSFIKISTEAVSTISNLSHMQIWVNGIPQYKKGSEPKAKSKVKWTNKWKVGLRRGRNSIRFVCYDEDGTGSLEKFVVIECQKEYEKPNLYVALVSVSKYQNSTMNLQYAVKDGRDFAKVYIDSIGRKQIGFPSRFGKVVLDTFFNENATRDKVVQWKSKLKKTKPEDYVLLYVSGHGLLDTGFNFWFGLHDINFDDPAQGGISFNELEDLLVGIPAQQKLFLMDACHSGEILDEEIRVDSTFILPDGSRGQLTGYSYKGGGIADFDEETINKTELKQELFSNYNSRSGATVISAAAGNSFALESPEWSNGVFTYTIIGGLVYRWADANDDGEVSVVELSRYVTKMVKEQTGGMQVPNDRQENIENNFRVW